MKFAITPVKFGSVGDLALELRKALTAIAAGWNVDHKPDGTHKIPLPVPGDTGDVLTSIDGEWVSEPPPSSAGIHAPTHSNGSTDPVTVTNLAGYPGGTTTFLRADGAFAAPPGGGGGAHATTHQPGGADPMAVDAVAATGSLRTLGTGAQQAASGTDSRFTNARTPTAHATTHQPGGSDAMAVDAAAATGSLRTLGTTSTSAAAGNDARFTDARTPTAHAPTHKSGGSDAITLDELAAPTDITTLNATTSAHGLLPKLSGTGTQFLNGTGLWLTPPGAGDVAGPPSAVSGNVTVFTGTTGKFIADSGIASGQVAQRDQINTFTAAQNFTDAVEFTNQVTFRSTAPLFHFVETDAPADAKTWQVTANGQFFQVNTFTDAGSPLVTTLQCDRTGRVYIAGSISERGRGTPLGDWIDFTPTMTASAGTVTVNTASTCRYTLIGKTMVVTFYLAITLSTTPGNLVFALPGGVTAASVTANALLDPTGTALMFQTVTGYTDAFLYRNVAGTGSWPTGATTIAATVTFPIV